MKMAQPRFTDYYDTPLRFMTVTITLPPTLTTILTTLNPRFKITIKLTLKKTTKRIRKLWYLPKSRTFIRNTRPSLLISSKNTTKEL